jgi:hypothetical protein
VRNIKDIPQIDFARSSAGSRGGSSTATPAAGDDQCAEDS